jgi:hypothetical protein
VAFGASRSRDAGPRLGEGSELSRALLVHHRLALLGERIVGPGDFAVIQARDPTNTGRWSFEVHRLVVAGDTVVSEVTVTDGEQSARVVAFCDIDGDHIVRQVVRPPRIRRCPAEKT